MADTNAHAPPTATIGCLTANRTQQNHAHERTSGIHPPKLPPRWWARKRRVLLSLGQFSHLPERHVAHPLEASADGGVHRKRNHGLPADATCIRTRTRLRTRLPLDGARGRIRWPALNHPQPAHAVDGHIRSWGTVGRCFARARIKQQLRQELQSKAAPYGRPARHEACKRRQKVRRDDWPLSCRFRPSLALTLLAHTARSLSHRRPRSALRWQSPGTTQP